MLKRNYINVNLIVKNDELRGNDNYTGTNIIIADLTNEVLDSIIDKQDKIINEGKLKELIMSHFSVEDMQNTICSDIKQETGKIIKAHMINLDRNIIFDVLEVSRQNSDMPVHTMMIKCLEIDYKNIGHNGFNTVEDLFNYYRDLSEETILSNYDDYFCQD